MTTTYTKQKQFFGLFGWLLLSFATSAIGALASIQAKSFYGQLEQPEWAPPAWLFGPVWTVLFALMGIAAWRVWRSAGVSGRGKALTLFLGQLLLNGLWSWLFFAWRLGGLAFAEIVLLWLAILLTMTAFWKVDRLAAFLLLPYLAWVGFASVLNLVLWRLNPGLLGG